MLSNYDFKCGVCYQTDFDRSKCHKNYAEYYDHYDDSLSHLRLEFINRFAPNITSLLDVGYGNGSFLKCASKMYPRCYGYDIADVPLPEPIERVNNLSGDYDMITFFDSLEHFDNILFVKDLSTKYLTISVPNCKRYDNWFRDWAHRKPNEHKWHFNLETMGNFLEECGYTLTLSSYFEDEIRKSATTENILTVIAVKTTKKENKNNG